MIMTRHWLKKLRLLPRITSQTKSIRHNLQATTREEPQSQSYEENKRKLIEQAIQLIDACQEFLAPDQKALELSDYEELAPEEVELSLTELLVLFRRTLTQLQETPADVQQNAIDVLYSYFIELQGLYDLIFVRRYETNLFDIPRSLSAIEDYHKRYFRCFQFTAQSLTRLKEDGVPLDILNKLETLQGQKLITEEKFLSDMETLLGKDQTQRYKSAILKQAQVIRDLASDPLIQEYKSIPYQDLMNISVVHHLRVVRSMLGPLIVTALKEYFQGKPRCQRRLDPAQIDTVETLRACLAKYPLTEAAKLGMAFHRHLMRIADLLGTRMALHWGRPIFELLILATWCQTVKDHIVPGYHKPRWQAAHLDLKQDEAQEVTDKNGSSGTIRMSSAFFMQPRVTFRLERFLIFKNRTMTVGDLVRPTEFGNWMRQNSPDESLQFFNVALGDLGGLGIRTMPEHEIVETEDTLWLYRALMQFVPGGMSSPGSIKMREANYGLTKAGQLLHDLQYYDPRFKRSSRFFTDLKTILNTFRVLKKGRVGKALQDTESFEGKKRGF